MEKKTDLLPDIDDYIRSLDNNAPVQIPELDEIVETVVAKTKLDQISAEIVVRLMFQEIRNAMLNGEVVTLRGLGEFYISSPKTGNKLRVFPKFKPYKSLVRKLNER